MSDSGSGLPPAGWYDDPEQPGQHRYWDGTTWTDERRPASGTTPPPAPGAPTAAATWPGSTSPTGPYGDTGAGYGAVAMGTRPDPWLWQSIVATLLCCLPLGIAGIVFAAQSQSAWANGNAAEAKEKADKARLFTLISVGIGVLVVVGFGISLLVAASAGS